jgi:hypothetical protein
LKRGGGRLLSDTNRIVPQDLTSLIDLSKLLLKRDERGGGEEMREERVKE